MNNATGIRAEGLFPKPDLAHEILVVPEQPLMVHRSSGPVANRRHSDREALAGGRNRGTIRQGHRLGEGTGHHPSYGSPGAGAEADRVGLDGDVISLIQIPERITRRLKDSTIRESLDGLYAISRLFKAASGGEPADFDKAERIADDAIDLARDKGLAGKALVDFITSKQEGVKKRERNDVRSVPYLGKVGKLKINEAKGMVDFSITGLTADEVRDLKLKLEKLEKLGDTP